MPAKYNCLYIIGFTKEVLKLCKLGLKLDLCKYIVLGSLVAHRLLRLLADGCRASVYDLAGGL